MLPTPEPGDSDRTTLTPAHDYGRYELLARIGEGLRGPVFLARVRGEPSTSPLYVIELSAFATGEDEPERTFQRDLAAAARIRHKNVLGIVELGENAAGHYAVMEYIEGATLAELQDRHRAIRPPRLVLTTVMDALFGLHAAHTLRVDGVAQPLLHGALSPEQLRIGLDGVCRLSGFGNVRPRVQTKPSHRTRSASGYMAPEQLTGGAVDHRADLFSIGVVLWNALTGRKLFHDRVEHQTMANILEREIPRPSSIGLAPPPVLDAIVLKALARSPAHRFQDAAEMASALREVARQAGCLAADAEVSEWVTTTFGSELASRRRAIRELAQRPPRAESEVGVLAGLGGLQGAEVTARDELSFDELARASDPPPAPAPAPPVLAPIEMRPIARPDPFARRLALVGGAAFAVVALVLGWRAAGTGRDPAPEVQAIAAPQLPIEVEVTVLDVHVMATPAVAPDPTPAPAPAPPRPAPVASKPARPRTPPRPAPSPQIKAPEPRPTPAPTAVESNPYVYK